MKSIALLAAFAGLALLSSRSPASAQNPAVCPGLTGQQRTDCLRQEVNRSNAAAASANAYVDSLNKSMRTACDAAQTADAAARLLQRSPNTPVKWAGRTWTSARTLADAALGQTGECNRLRQEISRNQRR